MLENIRLAFRGIWSHKMRSFLTMLGIIIGIASIIAIVSTIKGTNEEIKKNVVGQGDSILNIKLYQDDMEYEYDNGGIPNGVYEVRDEELEQIKSLPKVDSVATYHEREVYDSVYYQQTAFSSGQIRGVDKQYLKTCGYKVAQGRSITQKDLEEYRKVALIDENTKDSLFQGKDAVGKTIEIKGEPFVVVGVVKKDSDYKLSIHSLEDYYTYAEQSGGVIMIPDSTWPIVYQYDEPSDVAIKVETVDDMTKVGKKAAEILNTYIQPSDDSIKYRFDDLLQQAKEIQQLSQSTNMMLIWIAAISLLVGGIGVMNIMLVSVTERTNEIGLKKAIGARKSKIMWQFLTEAVVLTSIGGLLGVITGIILAKVISVVSSTPTSISVVASVGAVLFSMVIGIVFGIIPSHKAANLDPIDALRHE